MPLTIKKIQQLAIKNDISLLSFFFEAAQQRDWQTVLLILANSDNFISTKTKNTYHPKHWTIKHISTNLATYLFY